MFARKWVYQKITLQDYLPEIISSLQCGDLRAVCDGSFDCSYGTVPWCLEGSGSIIQGANVVPIRSDTLDPVRCEFGGIYTILRITDLMVVYCNLEGVAVEIWCDYEGGLRRTLSRQTISPLNYVNCLHLDMVNAINNIV